MYFKNILVPYDESDHAKSALHIALGLAGPYPDPTSYERIMQSVAENACSDAQALIEQSRDDAQCEIVADAVISSSPVEGIADYVRSHDIDLVVMGRRGLGALRGMIGSVSFGVLRSVDVPVLTVK